MRTWSVSYVVSITFDKGQNSKVFVKTTLATFRKLSIHHGRYKKIAVSTDYFSRKKKRFWILFPPFLRESPSVSTTYYVKRRRTDARHNCLFDWLSGVTWRIMQYVTIQPFSIRRESLIQIWVSSEPTSITSPPRFLIKCPSSLCYLFLRTNGVTLSHYPIGMTTSFANPDSWPHFRHCFSVDADAAIYLWLRRSCSALWGTIVVVPLPSSILCKCAFFRESELVVRSMRSGFVAISLSLL